MEACYMCDNAKINSDLTDENDYSAIGVGNSADGYRFMITSGWGKPLTIEFDIWDDKPNRKIWVTHGKYRPKYCPNCGRKIVEYPQSDDSKG